MKTWLFAVVRNVARKERRRVFRDAGRRASVTESQDVPVENGEPLENTRRRAVLQAAIAGLPERQRELLQLVVHRECTLEEAARILRIRLGSARTHYHRAKAALRDRLDENL